MEPGRARRVPGRDGGLTLFGRSLVLRCTGRRGSRWAPCSCGLRRVRRRLKRARTSLALVALTLVCRVDVVERRARGGLRLQRAQPRLGQAVLALAVLSLALVAPGARRGDLSLAAARRGRRAGGVGAAPARAPARLARSGPPLHRLLRGRIVQGNAFQAALGRGLAAGDQGYSLAVGGHVARPLSLRGRARRGARVHGDARLPGGFSTQRWRGVRMSDVLARQAREVTVSVISVTGYRWSFSAGDRELLPPTSAASRSRLPRRAVQLVAPGGAGSSGSSG